MCASFSSHPPAASEGYIPAGSTELYYREIGQGQPIIALHGGPDFDHLYLLPDLDRLADSFRLIYYDQRGRGRSAANVQSEDVTLQSDVDDLDSLRAHLQLDVVALLGHSWGGLLAMEYALRHSDRVSHLILMNSAPASRDDHLLMRQERLKTAASDMEELKRRAASAGYREGDPDAVAEYYRVHFRSALKRREHHERLLQSLRASFTREGILKARAIEERLMDETWRVSGYDLLPELRRLEIPTLVLHGEVDFVPLVCAAHIAGSIPGARLVLLENCGHFTYLECPDEVHREVVDFFRGGLRSGLPRLDPCRLSTRKYNITHGRTRKRLTTAP